ncbi:squalene cyclase [Microbacterium sp. Sa4CUA7]|uniref:Squalene cyclase n=1 Tax=Microbacterium pullorum TaxID=2762236 RepID=A0ABR8S5N2_9MICO|nr:squalene cyclase [Microbacterium pullorum]MBD7958771.1 squalene cyclase [Microbacterium pullorum]
MTEDARTWLLDSDPALRWQVERDLVHAPPQVWQATRDRVAREGFGARLLSLQDPDGQWAGGAFFPHDATADDPGQPWTATTWSLNSLREWGVDAAALGDTAQRLHDHARWEYEDLPYWAGEVDCCINAYTLANGAWLGADVTGIRQWFLDHRLADGGWNCEWIEGSRRSSFHSTLNTVKGLLWYERAVGGDDALRAARHAGQEYLLARRLLRRLSDGEPVAAWTTRFAAPFRWRFNVMNALDHFRAAAQYDGVPPDPRLAEAVTLVRAARQPDGTWLQQEREAGRVWFDIDAGPGAPSKWLALIGTRVLAWWDENAVPGNITS